MKMKIDLKSLCVGTLLGMLAVASLGAATKSEKAMIWEYKTVRGKVFQGQLEAEMNAAAADGWEFVALSSFDAEQHAVVVMRKAK